MRISDWSSDVCSSDLPSSAAIIAKGTKPAQATAIGLLPVFTPATCTRPARSAASSAALDCTGKKATSLPVTSDRCAMKPSQPPLYTDWTSIGGQETQSVTGTLPSAGLRDQSCAGVPAHT